MSHFDELISGNAMVNPSQCLKGFSNDNFLPLLEIFSGIPVSDNKRNAETVSDTNSGSSSVTPTDTKKMIKKRNSSGSVKRDKNSSKEEDKLKEVVHVRARRGQATDSHSLAERARREKINERMRCLQDLVPGCYKAMGMAGILDEIINYVQALQNQVEFLSMKLSAASSFHDSNLDIETSTSQQLLQVGDAYQTLELERLIREEYGSCTTFQPAMHF